jgi:hypothetical protein
MRGGNLTFRIRCSPPLGITAIKDYMKRIASILITLLLSLTLITSARSQVEVGVNIDNPPACEFGYYPYPPYSCAYEGYYGPGYFYNDIFLGVGPWFGWGFRHGWGHHKFNGPSGINRPRPERRPYGAALNNRFRSIQNNYHSSFHGSIGRR